LSEKASNSSNICGTGTSTDFQLHCIDSAFSKLFFSLLILPTSRTVCSRKKNCSLHFNDKNKDVESNCLHLERPEEGLESRIRSD